MNENSELPRDGAPAKGEEGNRARTGNRFVAKAHPWVAEKDGVIYVARGFRSPLRLVAPTAWVWEELQQPRTIGQLCVALLDEAADSGHGRSLIVNQVEALVSHGLVESAGPSDAFSAPGPPADVSVNTQVGCLEYPLAGRQGTREAHASDPPRRRSADES